MKTFDELNRAQQIRAIKFTADTLIHHVIEGFIELSMPNKQLQVDWEHMLAVSKRLNNSDLIKYALLNHSPFRRIVNKIALETAQDARYNDSCETLMDAEELI